MSHIISTYVDRWISQILVAENEKEKQDHISSGKLSASMLGKPLQSQILKVMGVPPKEVDQYVLRKFRRGKDVEAWLVKSLPGLKETQRPALYRNVVGFIDAMVSTKNWEREFGVIPLEVKSVTNAKYKNIQKSGEADRGHILQACLYALSEGTENFAICYIASDDYRTHTMVYQTADHKTEVDRIIDEFEKQLATGVIPVFKAIEKWQENPMYADYPDWMSLDEQQLLEKYKKEYGTKSLQTS